MTMFITVCAIIVIRIVVAVVMDRISWASKLVLSVLGFMSSCR